MQNEQYLLCKPPKTSENAGSNKEKDKKGQNVKFNNANHGEKQKRRQFCHICKVDSHKTAYCEKLSKIKGMNEKIEFLKKANICNICLKPDQPNHNCLSDYRCSKHNCNLILCCTKVKKFGNNQQNANEAQTQLNTSSMQMNQSANKIQTTCLITEVIKCVDSDGNRHKILVLYDQGNSHTAIDHETASRIYGQKNLDMNFTVNNFASGKVMKKGCSMNIQIETKSGVEEISCFGIQDLKQDYEQQSFNVPQEWRTKYNLVKTPKSAYGVATLCIGLDKPHLLPSDLENFDGVSILRSRVTGNLILAGKVIQQEGAKMARSHPDSGSDSILGHDKHG